MLNSNIRLKIYFKLMKLKYFKKLFFFIRGEADIESLVARGLKVGSNCSFQNGVKIDESHCWHIQIGNDVTIGPRVMILAHDASMKRHPGYTKFGKVKIGNKVFIGAGTIVLPNVIIGDNSIIGAGVFYLKKFFIKHKSYLENFPLFIEEYTLKQNINQKMKPGNEQQNRWLGVCQII